MVWKALEGSAGFAGFFKAMGSFERLWEALGGCFERLWLWKALGSF